MIKAQVRETGITAQTQDNEAAGSEAAESVRKKYGLGVAPIANLPFFVEEVAGLDVLVAGMPEGVDALTLNTPDGDRTCMAIATTENAERQRFSIAHELGHAVFGDLLEHSELVGGDRSTEDRAQCFARHFLIPTKGVTQYLGQLNESGAALSEMHLSGLVQHFGVSAIVAARQLHHMGLIDPDLYGEWSLLEASDLAVKYGWDLERQVMVRAATVERSPQRIVAKATEAYVKGLIPLSTLAAVRHDRSLDVTREWLARNSLTVADRQQPERMTVEMDEI